MDNTFLYAGEDLPKVWEAFGVTFYIKLDSYNKIYAIKFQSPENQVLYFDLLLKQVENEELDHLISSMGKKVYAQRDEKLDPLLFDRSLFQLREALLKLKGEVKLQQYDYNRIICRCAGIDLQTFQELFIQSHGNKKELVRKSNMLMTCGHCKDEFNFYYDNLQQISPENSNVDFSQLCEQVVESIIDFKTYTSVDLTGHDLTLVRLEQTHLIFKIKDAKKIAIDKLQNELVNFFSAKLNQVMTVELTLS
jgi:hypothetical protein